MDLPIPPTSREYGRSADLQIPKIPRRQNQSKLSGRAENELKEKLKFLLKRRGYLINELKEKEQRNQNVELALTYAQINAGMSAFIKQL